MQAQTMGKVWLSNIFLLNSIYLEELGWYIASVLPQGPASYALPSGCLWLCELQDSQER